MEEVTIGTIEGWLAGGYVLLIEDEELAEYGIDTTDARKAYDKMLTAGPPLWIIERTNDPHFAPTDGWLRVVFVEVGTKGNKRLVTYGGAHNGMAV